MTRRSWRIRAKGRCESGRGHPCRPWWACFLAAVSLFLTVTPVLAADVERGERLAIKHCAFCHVVGDHNKFGGIGSTPSFRLLAGMRDGDERFQTFFDRLPHPSFVFLPDQEPPTALPMAVPPVRLSYDDIRDIAAFAATLNRPKSKD